MNICNNVNTGHQTIRQKERGGRKNGVYSLIKTYRAQNQEFSAANRQS